MKASNQVYSDMLAKLENAVGFAQNNEGRKTEICKRVDNRTEEDVSSKDVSDILDSLNKEDLKEISKKIGDEIYSQTDAVEQSNFPTGGEKMMADGGGLFSSDRGERIFYVSVSLFSTCLTTVHLTQGDAIGAVLTGWVVAVCFAMYLSNEYNVQLELKYR